MTIASVVHLDLSPDPYSYDAAANTIATFVDTELLGREDRLYYKELIRNGNPPWLIDIRVIRGNIRIRHSLDVPLWQVERDLVTILQHHASTGHLEARMLPHGIQVIEAPRGDEVFVPAPPKATGFTTRARFSGETPGVFVSFTFD